MAARNGGRTRAGIATSLLVATGVLVLATLGPPSWSAVPAPAPPAPATTPADVASVRQSVMVDALDARLREVVRSVPWRAGPYLDRVHGAPLLVLPARAGAYTVDDLVREDVARWTAPDVLTVRTDVLVAPGAALELNRPGLEIRLAGDGPRTITAWRGDLVLRGAPGDPVRVSSWDERTGAVDGDPSDGRAHLRVLGGRLDVGDAELTGLGFWSGRTGGLAVTGVPGERGTATVRRTAVTGGWYGFYADDTAVTIEDSRFSGAAADAVRLHRGVHGAVLTRVRAEHAAGAGVAAGRGASELTLSEVATVGNAVGTLIDAGPLAEGPGPGGEPTTGYAGFRIDGLVSRDDREAGVVVDGAAEVRMTGADVRRSRDGVVVRGAAHDVRISGARVGDVRGVAIAVRDGVRATTIDDAVVDGGPLGLQVRDASALVRRPSVTGATRHAVSVVGAATGTAVLDGRVAGTGPSAVDLSRLAPGVAVDLRGTDAAAWTVRRDAATVLQHTLTRPMLVVWLVVALGPLPVVWLQRRRAATRPRVPYPGRSGALPPRVAVRVSLRVPGGPRITVVDEP